MCFPPFDLRSFRWLLLITLALGAYPAAAQTPVPDGSDRHPSDYRHPVLTWTPLEPEQESISSKDRRLPSAILADRLQSIVVPKVEFRQTTLNDAVEYLRQEGHRLDPEPDPAKRGVNIVVQFPTPIPPVSYPPIPGLPSEPTPAPDSTPRILTNGQTPVTLSMSRLPLLEALKYLAQQVGLKVKVEPDAVYMVPANSPHLMISAVFRLPPESLGDPPDTHVPTPEEEAEEDKTGMVYHADTKSRLESEGIEFPPGASAVYRPFTRRLFVRNTQENLDKIAVWISSALKTPAPAPANP